MVRYHSHKHNKQNWDVNFIINFCQLKLLYSGKLLRQNAFMNFVLLGLSAKVFSTKNWGGGGAGYPFVVLTHVCVCNCTCGGHTLKLSP